MVVKIQPNADIYAAYDYNGRKATGAEGIHDEVQSLLDEKNGEKGHLIVTRNVPEISDIKNEFARLIMKNQKTKGKPLKETCFHVSVNPGEDDTPLTEKQVVKLTDEIMKKMGYGDSPYALFKHTDTGRTHYHIVASRIGQDGKKINDSFENRRINKIAEELGLKYGFVMGNPDSVPEEDISEEETAETSVKTQETAGKAPVTTESRKDEETPAVEKKTQQKAKEEAKKKPEIQAYLPENRMPLKEQFAILHNEAMKWHFSTPEQYQAIMERRFNVMVEEYDDGLHFYGMQDREKTTNPLTETEIGIHAIRDILGKCKDEKMSARVSQRKHINELTEWAAGQSSTWKDFQKLMFRKGVIIVTHWTEENELFGVTYLDRATRCAWKASETAVNIAWLKKTATEKGWKIVPDPAKRKKREPEAKEKKQYTAPSATLKSKEMPVMKADKSRPVRMTSAPSTMARMTQALEGLKHTGRHSNAGNDRKDDIYEDEAAKIMNWKAM